MANITDQNIVKSTAGSREAGWYRRLSVELQRPVEMVIDGAPWRAAVRANHRPLHAVDRRPGGIGTTADETVMPAGRRSSQPIHPTACREPAPAI